jgi:hypothetical protein
MGILSRHVLLGLAAVGLSALVAARAEVIGIEVLERASFASGVPLGTHTGWNQRAPETGFPWATARFDGSFVPFARTEAERRSSDDQRPSIESRYPTRGAFVAKVQVAAKRQVTAGFLLPEVSNALYPRI